MVVVVVSVMMTRDALGVNGIGVTEQEVEGVK